MKSTLKHSWTEEERVVWDSFHVMTPAPQELEEKKERIWRRHPHLLRCYIRLCSLTLELCLSCHVLSHMLTHTPTYTDSQIFIIITTIITLEHTNKWESLRACGNERATSRTHTKEQGLLSVYPSKYFSLHPLLSGRLTSKSRSWQGVQGNYPFYTLWLHFHREPKWDLRIVQCTGVS